MPHGGRHMFWVDSVLDLQVASGGQTISSLMPGLSDDVKRSGMTLMRIILCLDVAHLIPDSGEGIQNVALGVGIASQEAFLGSVLPEPATQFDFPQGGWIFRCRLRTYGFAADVGAVYNRVIERDLRNKRKINNGELYIIAENAAEFGITSVVVVAGIVRCLMLST